MVSFFLENVVLSIKLQGFSNSASAGFFSSVTRLGNNQNVAPEICKQMLNPASILF